MKIINCGSLNLDYVYSVDHMVQKGETLSSISMETFCGGKGLNQSIALCKSGISVYHAGRVGRTNGDMLLKMLEDVGVNTDFVSIVEEETGHAIIQRNLAGDNCILLYGGANIGIEKPWIDELSSHFEAGDYLLLQNEISNLPYIMEKAIDAGVHIILNPSPMDQQVLDCPIKQVDYIILNEIEAAEICGLVRKIKDEQLARKLAESFPNTKVILTLGEKGALYLEKGNIIRQESFHVPVVDTTAAGDTFTGYFFGSILSGMKPETALQRAAKAAAIAVTKKGAAPSRSPRSGWFLFRINITCRIEPCKDNLTGLYSLISGELILPDPASEAQLIHSYLKLWNAGCSFLPMQYRFD